MKRLESILTVVIFCVSSLSFAQNYSPIDFKNQIILTPFAAFDMDPSIRVSFERKFDTYNGIQLQAGYMYTLRNRNQLQETNSSNSGVLLAAEYRRYLPSNNNENFYFGLRLHGFKSDLSKLLWFDTLNVVGNDFQHPTRQEKQVCSALFIGGLSFCSNKHLTLDLVLGIGASFRRVKNYVPENYGDPIFIKDIRARISNRDYNGWFMPFPYFQINVGWSW